MIRELKLPDSGMGITEATIVKWIKAVGDTVAVGDVIAEMETAKSTVEIEAVFSGTIEELMVLEGDTVEVDAPIARLRVAE